jgi:hypothetical protein
VDLSDAERDLTLEQRIARAPELLSRHAAHLARRIGTEPW